MPNSVASVFFLSVLAPQVLHFSFPWARENQIYLRYFRCRKYYMALTQKNLTAAQYIQYTNKASSPVGSDSPKWNKNRIEYLLK